MTTFLTESRTPMFAATCRRMCAAIGVGVAICATAQVDAGFVGLQLEIHASVQTPQGPRQVLRLYAMFTDPNDHVTDWGAMQSFSTTFSTSHCTGQLGGNFFNPGGSTAPTQEAIDEFAPTQWDTFATIGVSIADQGSTPPPLPPDATNTIGIGNFISGNQITFTQGAVYVQPPDAPQSFAGYAADGDPQLRVMLAQFTISPEDAIWGSKIGYIRWKDGVSQQTFTATNLQITILDAWGTCCLGTSCFTSSLGGCGQAGGTFLGCQPCTSCPPPKPPCSGDVSPSGGDGEVNVQDMLAVINAWGACPAPCASDLNTDGTVNVADLLGVINAWGPCE
jgi:hypothetical protein